MKAYILLLLSAVMLLIACRKEGFITSADARLSISADTLKFDTVFTTTGSVTQFFKIINENNQKLRLSSVKLLGGPSSAFKMNVDGFSATEVNNIDIEANDSVYVFIQVNVNPNSANLPFVILDSIEINYNGNNRLVQLEAYGQNAHFLREKEITANEIWTNDLPYVILGYLHINENTKLAINKGCRVYIHADAPILVDGSLEVRGEKDTADRVYFNGDRLDVPYRDFPASWPGIYFRTSSKDNVFNYAVIKNAYQAIAMVDLASNANPKLTLNECIIDNAYDAGIVTVNSSIKARNCLISNCGKNILLTKGGNYEFTHCTVASYSNSFILHRDSVLSIFNYDLNNPSATARLDAIFRNCIFWGEFGTVNNEIGVYKNGSGIFNLTFEGVLWKVQNPPPNAIVINPPPPITNQSPQFDSINTTRNYYDFRLKNSSPAIGAGTNAGVALDLMGNPRPVGLPDLGCYEKQP